MASLFLLAGCGGGDEGESADAPPKPRIEVRGAAAEINEVDANPAEDFGRGVTVLGQPVEIEGKVSRGERATLSFPLTDTAPTGEKLMVATRERPNDAWRLLPAEVRGDRATVRVRSFSEFSLVSVARRFLPDPIEDIRQRRDPPECSSEEGVSLEVQASDRADPLLFACAESGDSGPSVRLYSNRAAGIGFLLPKGASLRTTGSSLTEASWNLIYEGIDQVELGTERILPAGGEAVVTFEGSGGELRLVPTNQAIVLDVFLTVLPDELLTGTAKSGKALADLAACVFDSQVGPGIPGVGDLLDIWSSCGSALGQSGIAIAGAAFFGIPRLAQALADQFEGLSGAEVMVRVSEDPASSASARECGDIFNDGFFLGAVIAVGVDCDEAIQVVNSWAETDCRGGGCEVDGFQCKVIEERFEYGKWGCSAGDRYVRFETAS